FRTCRRPNHFSTSVALTTTSGAPAVGTPPIASSSLALRSGPAATSASARHEARIRGRATETQQPGTERRPATLVPNRAPAQPSLDVGLDHAPDRGQDQVP